MFGHTHQKRQSLRNNARAHRQLIPRNKKTEAYGIIKKALGNCTFTWENVNTGKENFTITAGRLTRGPNKVYIKEGDLVLIEIIDINVNKDRYIIKHTYTPAEARELTSNGELVRENLPDDIQQSIVFESDIVNTNQESDSINIDDI